MKQFYLLNANAISLDIQIARPYFYKWFFFSEKNSECTYV